MAAIIPFCIQPCGFQLASFSSKKVDPITSLPRHTKINYLINFRTPIFSSSGYQHKLLLQRKKKKKKKMAKEIKSSQFHLPAAQQQQQEGASHKPRTRLQQLRAENGPAVGGQETKITPEKDINECAEDFINRFRQNLQLQRLQSIENYREMLARGL